MCRFILITCPTCKVEQYRAVSALSFPVKHINHDTGKPQIGVFSENCAKRAETGRGCEYKQGESFVMNEEEVVCTACRLKPRKEKG